MINKTSPQIQPSEGKAPSGSSAPAYYIPGHNHGKIFMIIFGLLVMAFGISQMLLPLRLLFFGSRATAEATRVIKTEPGSPDLILTNDTEIQAHQETRNRHSTFWNEFCFQDGTSHDVVVRAPIGSQLKPLYPLMDEDGLPTTLLVDYDPKHPKNVSFPTIFSTWFAPSLLTLVGLGIIITGSTLLYWANKPIELPHLNA